MLMLEEPPFPIFAYENLLLIIGEQGKVTVFLIRDKNKHGLFTYRLSLVVELTLLQFDRGMLTLLTTYVSQKLGTSDILYS